MGVEDPSMSIRAESAMNSGPPFEGGNESSFVTLSVREALLGLKNGQVTITVHNGEIVQIDKILRKRQFKSRPHS